MHKGGNRRPEQLRLEHGPSRARPEPCWARAGPGSPASPFANPINAHEKKNYSACNWRNMVI